MRNMDAKKHQKKPPKHGPGAQGGGSPWCIPMNKVSLNDAFLVRYISEGPTRNQCHVTAIEIIGRRTPNLDPQVLCCKIGSNIISYLNKHKIWPKYGILSQWRLHTKLNKASTCVFAVFSTNWRYQFNSIQIFYWHPKGLVRPMSHTKQQCILQ